MTLATKFTSRLNVCAAAALFSTGGAAIKSCGLTAWQVAGFRSAIAAVALLLLLPASRLWSWRRALVGTAYAATMILFVLGNRLTTAANTIFLQSTAPLYVLLLGPWLLREKIQRRDLFFLLALAAGFGLFFVGVEPPRKTAPNPEAGNFLAALAGFCWALTLVGLRWVERRESVDAGGGASAVAIGNLMAFAVSIPQLFPVPSVNAVDWLVVGYLGIVQIGLAYLFLTRGLQRVPAFEASLLLLIEPVLNPIWAWLIQSEVPSYWAVAGGLIIIVSTGAKTAVDARLSRPRLHEGKASFKP